MYFDKKRRRWQYLALAILVVAAALGVCFRTVQVSGPDIEEEGTKALKAAVERSALQCYVVEGAYPVDAAYLEERYGLQINREDFYVNYDVFASNLPPDVRVTRRHGGSRTE